MSRVRKFAGLWIVLIMFGGVFPGAFYLASAWLDGFLALPGIMPEPNNVFPAAFGLLAGLFWVLWAYSYLHFVGKGSPVEAFGVALYPTQRLVTSGPYAYTRNPMILGLLFIFLAIAFAANSTGGLILIPILALLTVAYIKAFEEPELARRFGEAYTEYREAVPVLIPSLKPRGPSAG